MLIGQHAITRSREAIRAINPATDKSLEPTYPGGTAEHVEQACALAWAAALDSYCGTPLAAPAHFLEAIANNIAALGDELIERAIAETGLPRPRIQGERCRTCQQLHTFGTVEFAGQDRPPDHGAPWQLHRLSKGLFKRDLNADAATP